MGKSKRAVVEDSSDSEDDEKQATPCNNYRVDTEGINFGDCRCGHSKQAHFQKNKNNASSALNNLRHEDTDSDDDEYEGKKPEPCNNYRLDTEGANFGDCKCGWPRIAHQKSEENVAAKALARLKSKRHDKADLPDSGICTTFRVDTSAAEFGVCVYCGLKRSEHGKKDENMASQALKNMKEKNKRKNEEANRLAYADRDTVKEKLADQKAKINAADNTKGPAITQSPEQKVVASGKGGCCTIC